MVDKRSVLLYYNGCISLLIVQYLNDRENRQPEYSLFLGDLTHECSEQMLLVSGLMKRYRKSHFSIPSPY